MRTGVLHVWNSRGCNQDQRERRNTNKFRSRWRVLHLAEMHKTCERDRWETPNEPDPLDTRMLSSCDKDSWKVIHDLRARCWFDRFNSSGLRIAPSCKQHPQRPGAFVRSAWARGSFPGRIYRHPEQRFKGNNLCTYTLMRLCFRRSFLNYFSLAGTGISAFVDNCGEQRWNYFWERQHSHTRHSGALSRVSVFVSLNCIWLWINFCKRHQEYLHLLFDIPGEWERISNCLNEIRVRGMLSHYSFFHRLSVLPPLSQLTK